MAPAHDFPITPAVAWMKWNGIRDGALGHRASRITLSLHPGYGWRGIEQGFTVSPECWRVVDMYRTN